MPSPKAVLADIYNLKLDPSRRHHKIRASGHLAVPAEPSVNSYAAATSSISTITVAVPVVSEPVLATMARLMEEVVEETPELVLPEPVPESKGAAFRALVQRVGEPPFSMMAAASPPEEEEVKPIADQVAGKAEEAIEASTTKKKPPKKGKKEASEDPSGSAS